MFIFSLQRRTNLGQDKALSCRSGETRYFLQPVTTCYSAGRHPLLSIRYWVAVEYDAALQSSALQAKRVVTSNDKPERVSE